MRKRPVRESAREQARESPREALREEAEAAAASGEDIVASTSAKMAIYFDNIIRDLGKDVHLRLEEQRALSKLKHVNIAVEKLTIDMIELLGSGVRNVLTSAAAKKDDAGGDVPGQPGRKQ
ncbi:MAG TPA: hypothetical protein VGG48_00810 [Rhizomicrobium sp.]